jgi:hypothetical protein
MDKKTSRAKPTSEKVNAQFTMDENARAVVAARAACKAVAAGADRGRNFYLTVDLSSLTFGSADSTLITLQRLVSFNGSALN